MGESSMSNTDETKNNINNTRGGIFKLSDDLIDKILYNVMAKVKENSDDLSLQREYSLNAPVGDGVEPCNN